MHAIQERGRRQKFHSTSQSLKQVTATAAAILHICFALAQRCNQRVLYKQLQLPFTINC
jgi:hypothetical protein